MGAERRATVLRSRLRAGQEAAYEADHARVPAALLSTLVAGGVRDWVIWRDGRQLLHLVDVDDYAALEQHLVGDAANEDWQATMAAHVEGFDDLSAEPALPAPAAPRLVWSMAAQVLGERLGEGTT